MINPKAILALFPRSLTNYIETCLNHLRISKFAILARIQIAPVVLSAIVFLCFRTFKATQLHYVRNVARADMRAPLLIKYNYATGAPSHHDKTGTVYPFKKRTQSNIL